MKKFRKYIITLIILPFIINTLNSCAKNPEKTFEVKTENITYDVIIVPGVPYDDTDWTKILLGRIYWSHYLFKNGITKNVIYSGSAVYTPYVEAKIMAMYGKQLGIPESKIFTETNAKHSIENVYYSYNMAKKLGFKKIALATDPFQSWMMQRPSKKMGIDIDFLPFSIEILDTLNIENLDIPADKAFVKDFVSLEDKENFFQRFKGTIGKNIEFKD